MTTELAAALDIFWILQSCVLMFTMQAGFALIEVGSVRAINARDIMMKNVLDACVCLLVWWLFGAAMAGEGGNRFLGTAETSFSLDSADGRSIACWLLGSMYASTSVTIVSGAVAERTHHVGYILSAVLISAVIFPTISHWLWASNGWLCHRNADAVLGGAFDFAGSGGVHLTGGVLALCGSALVGPRCGRFDGGEPQEMRGQSSSFIMLGTFLLWAGWLAFNMGSTLGISTTAAALTAAKVGTRTMLAGSSGCVAVTALEYCRSRSWSLPTTCYGILSGLVAVTASCATISGWAAVFIGAVGALLSYSTSFFVLLFKVDDVVDAFAVHGVPGAWGLLAAGLFADGSYSPDVVGLIYGGGARLIGAATLAIAAITLWSAAVGLLGLMLIRRLGCLHISTEMQGSAFGLNRLRGARAEIQMHRGRARGRPNAVERSARAAPPGAHHPAPSTFAISEVEPMADASIHGHGTSEGRVRNGLRVVRLGSTHQMTSAVRSAELSAV